MTLYCNYCETLIDESELTHRLADEEDYRNLIGTSVVACPYCNQSTTLEDAERCERCGEPIKPDTHLCKDCESELYKDVEGIINTFYGGYYDSKEAFFDYLERVWF